MLRCPRRRDVESVELPFVVVHPVVDVRRRDDCAHPGEPPRQRPVGRDVAQHVERHRHEIEAGEKGHHTRGPEGLAIVAEPPREGEDDEGEGRRSRDRQQQEHHEDVAAAGKSRHRSGHEMEAVVVGRVLDRVQERVRRREGVGVDKRRRHHEVLVPVGHREAVYLAAAFVAEGCEGDEDQHYEE